MYFVERKKDDGTWVRLSREYATENEAHFFTKLSNTNIAAGRDYRIIRVADKPS